MKTITSIFLILSSVASFSQWNQECIPERFFVSDSTIYYNGDGKAWIPESRFKVLERDQYGNTLFGITHFIDESGGETGNKYRYSFTWHDDSIRDEYTREVWDPAGSEWIVDFYLNYTENGDYIEFARKTRDFDNNVFTKGTRNVYIYDDNMIVTGRIDQVLDPITDTWQENWQYLYTYNEDNLQDTVLNQQWVGGAVGWKDMRRDVYNFDDDGNKTLQTVQYYVTGTGWEDRFKFFSEYDISGNLSLFRSEKWDFTGNSWVNLNKVEYEYDVRGNVTKETAGKWNAGEGEWIYTIRKFALWTEDDQRKYYLLQNWDSDLSGWVNAEKEVSRYNHDNTLAKQLNLEWNTESNRWERVSRILNNYDKYGNRTREIHQDWDSESRSWINIEKYENYYSFNIDLWGKKVPVCHKGHTIYISIHALDAHLAHGDCLGECLEEKDCHSCKDKWDDDDRWDDDKGKFKDWNKKKSYCNVYPNPFSHSTTVSFKNNDIQRVDLLDRTGYTLRTYTTTGSNEMSIHRGNLGKGIYFLRVITKEGVELKRIVIQ